MNRDVMNRLVIVYGLPRTGTTWAFNAVMTILKSEGSAVQGIYAGPSTDRAILGRYSDATSLVIKTHRLRHLRMAAEEVKGAKLRILLSMRDPGETILSQLRVGIVRQNAASTTSHDVIPHLKRLLRSYRRIRQELKATPKALIIDEQSINASGARIIQDIAQYIQVSLNTDKAVALANHLTRDAVTKAIQKRNIDLQRTGVFSEYDRETHWHANHIRDQDYSRQWQQGDMFIMNKISRVQARIKNLNEQKDF